jgi:hypothetical protein
VTPLLTFVGPPAGITAGLPSTIDPFRADRSVGNIGQTRPWPGDAGKFEDRSQREALLYDLLQQARNEAQRCQDQENAEGDF